MTKAEWNKENAVFKVGDVVFVYVAFNPKGKVEDNFLALAEITGYYTDGYKTYDSKICGRECCNDHHHTWLEGAILKFKDEIIKAFPKKYKDAYEAILRKQIKKIKLKREELTINEPVKVVFT